ncbi:MAG: hypothetical protein ACJAU6_001535 [Alphaproteobacteria bacterium]
MHDAVEGDRQGTPSIGVMTSNFVSAAELMARVLGADGYPFVTIDHPVSSATIEKLSQEAIKAVAAGAAILLATA